VFEDTWRDGMAHHVGIRQVGFRLLVPLRCCEVAWSIILVLFLSILWSSRVVWMAGWHTDDKRVLWQLFEETLLRGPVDVEVQGLCLAGQQSRTG
jgi:hypothetical protein